MTVAAALLLALLPSQDAWTPLPLPGPCVEEASTSHPAPLLEGSHLELRRSLRPARRATTAPLPANVIVSLIQEQARRGGSGLEVFPTAPPLLVRGPGGAVEDLRARLAELDAAGQRLEIAVDAWLVPTAEQAGDGESLPPFAAEARERGLAWSTRARSGEEVFLGEREARPFVAGYDVEVATDSGVAAPIVGRVVLGRTLHLIASRTADGERVLLEGILDLAELERVDTFDPGTPDLGEVEQPVVRSVQVAFAGAVASGEPLSVVVRGAPLAEPDWTLWIVPRAQAEPAPREGAGWELVDLSLLARAPRELPGLDPGASLSQDLGEQGLPRLVEAIAPSSLAAGAGDRRGGSFPTFSERLVLVERGDGSAARALRELAGALEEPRLRTATVEVALGDLSVVLPVAHGAHARVRVGAERTWLVDYDAEIAPDTWMPSPDVQPAFDGLAWQGVLSDDAVQCAYWIAGTAGASARTADQAKLGALQLPARRFRAGAATLRRGVAARELLTADGGGATLRAGVR